LPCVNKNKKKDFKKAKKPSYWTLHFYYIKNKTKQTNKQTKKKPKTPLPKKMHTENTARSVRQMTRRSENKE